MIFVLRETECTQAGERGRGRGYLFFFMFIFERERVGEGQRKRERIQSGLCADSREPILVLEFTNRETPT